MKGSQFSVLRSYLITSYSGGATTTTTIKRLFVTINAWDRCRFTPPKVTKSSARQWSLLCGQRQLWDQVKPSARPNAHICALVVFTANWPLLLRSSWLLLHSITTAENKPSNVPQIDGAWTHAADPCVRVKINVNSKESLIWRKITHDFRGLWMTVAIFLQDCNVIFQISV